MRIVRIAGFAPLLIPVSVFVMFGMVVSFARVPSGWNRARAEIPASPGIVDSPREDPPVRPIEERPADGTTGYLNDPASPRIADIARDYRQLRSMTSQPVHVDPRLAMMCRGAEEREVEAARKGTGPHAHSAVRIYMNELAANAFRGRSTTYPVGSVIVKEKRPQFYWSEATRRSIKPHDGVGGMVKRSPGFDRAHGDWEYFYFEEGSKIESGRITSCVGCHAGASTRDYVFGGWAERG
jgi:hypothetical protein